MKLNKNSLIAPLFVIIFIFGFWIGKLVYKDNSFFYSNNSDFRKVKVLIDYLQENYKDDIDITKFLEQNLIIKIKQLDPYADIIPAETFQDWSDKMLNNNFFGVGIRYVNWRDTIRILSVMPNSPSSKAGIEPLDMIVEINGKAVDDENFKINKKEEYSIKLIKYSTNKLINVKLKPQNIEYNNIAAKTLDSGIIYIQIKSFSKNLNTQFTQALDSLAQITDFKGIVIDLRGNGGGLLKSSISIAENFLSEGDTITITEDKYGKKKYYVAKKDGKYKELPLVILIDFQTASASEMLCMAIQDNDRGYLIGSTTFGKGVYQQDVKIYDIFAHITTGKYFGPSGRNVSRKSSTDTVLSKHGRRIVVSFGVNPDEFVSPAAKVDELLNLIDMQIPDSLFFTYVYNPKCQLRKINAKNQLYDYLKEYPYKYFQEKIRFNVDDFFKVKADTLLYIYWGRYVLPDDIIETIKINNDYLIKRAKVIIESDSINDYIFKEKIIKTKELETFH